MVKKKINILIGVLIIILVGGTFFLTQQKISNKPIQTKLVSIPKEGPVDYKASFAIFTNGTFRIFTAPMYHNLSPDVFIESANPNMVYVKKAGIIWDDFFKTLPMKLTKECLTTGTGQTFCTGEIGTLKFYLNGKRLDNFLDLEIKSGDKVLISFGNENETEVKKQLQQIPEIN